MRLVRLLLLLGAVVLVWYGLVRERHAVRSLDDKDEAAVAGPAFVEGATTDRFLRREGTLYDTQSAPGASGAAGIGDCPT